MRRRELIGIALACITWPRTGRTQQLPAHARLLGVLIPVSEGDRVAQLAAADLRQQLKKLGWSEGLRLRIDFRWSGFDNQRLSADAADLVRRDPDVILVSSTQALSALLRAKPAAPIVFVNVGNPIARGFIQSLAKPGHNITGFANADEALGGKRFEILKQIAPNLSRILVVGSRNNSAWPEQLGSVEGLANTFQLRLTSFDSDDNEKLERAARSFAQEANGGLYVLPSNYSWVSREAITAIASRNKLPAIYPYRAFVVSGGLMAYTYDGTEQWHGAASYIDRILRGAKPGDLPVQQSTQFQLVINLKTARTQGLTLPPSLLARADELIE